MADVADVAAVTASLYSILKPLESEDRRRVVKAALTLLGDADASSIDKAESVEVAPSDGSPEGFSPKVIGWLKKNNLDADALNNVFHVEGEVAEIIASEIPGKGGKEKTVNAYLLTGAKNFLTTGDGKFDDKSARDVCEALGCYNSTNHATYLKDRGNFLSGSKSTGWTLTAPGLKAVAELVREMSSS